MKVIQFLAIDVLIVYSSETREELTTELKELQSVLKELEAEELDLTTNIDISKQEVFKNDKMKYTVTVAKKSI